jgi:NAD(P)-dependent dehydrogenase (short-subunit alcohol dehydrogenase family)
MTTGWLPRRTLPAGRRVATTVAARAPCRGGAVADGQDSDRGTGRLAGRRALVTGGDTELGRAVALAFMQEGADLAFNYSPLPQCPADGPADVIAHSARRGGQKAVLLPGDLRTEGVCQQLVGDTVRELGGLDVLVVNATRRPVGADISQMSTEQFDAAFTSNIYAMFWLTKAALPHLHAGSSIINTSSPGASDDCDIQLDYSASKGAIMVFTSSLAKQLSSRGIRVNAVAPKPIWTPRAAHDELPASAAAGSLSDLASTYVLLASDESSYATGQLFGVVDSHARRSA